MAGLHNFFSEFQFTVDTIVDATRANLHITLSILALLWGLNYINRSLGYRLNVLGIFPRSVHGLLGIFISPFLHGDFNHVFFNSIPLFILSNLVLIGGAVLFFNVSLWIIIVAGLGLWAFGRPGFHVGSSTVIMGYFGYLLADAYQYPTMLTGAVVFLCLYYFGGLLFSVLPSEKFVSWEGHLFGLAAGVLVNLFYLQLPRVVF